MLRARSDDDKEARRDALIRAALDEFAEKGFTAARMDDIAKRAGLSKGAVYLYFASKEELFFALIDAVALAKIDEIEARMAEIADPREALDAVIGFAPALVRETPMPRLAKIIIADVGLAPDLADAYRERVVSRIEGALAELIARGRDQGLFDVPDPVSAARLVMAPVLFASLWRIVFDRDGRAPIDVEALFATHRAVIRKGFAAGEKG